MVNASRDIATEFTLGGQEAIEPYFKLIKPSVSNMALYYGQDSLGRCFDDIGVENVASNYGSKISVMTELILSIYNRDQHLQNFNTTHFTSNCDMEGVDKLYGPRATSRIAEMANIIEFPMDAPDKRTFSIQK